MRPIVRVFLIVASQAAAWFALRRGAADAVLSSAMGPASLPAWHAAIDAAPGYALILLGCYALATVGIAFLSFNDVSAKAEELKLVRAPRRIDARISVCRCSRCDFNMAALQRTPAATPTFCPVRTPRSFSPRSRAAGHRRG